MKRFIPTSLSTTVLTVGILALILSGIALVAQSYLSYSATTEAADRCYELGGFPEIEKSGWKMTYFECHVD